MIKQNGTVFCTCLKKIYIYYLSKPGRKKKKCFHWLWKRQVQSCIMMVTLFLLWNSRIWLLGHCKITLKGITYSMLPTKLRFIKFPLLSDYIKDLCWSDGTYFGQFGGGVYYPLHEHDIIFSTPSFIHALLYGAGLFSAILYIFSLLFWSFIHYSLFCKLNTDPILCICFSDFVSPSVCTLFDKYNWALALKENSSTQIYFLHFKYFIPQHKYISFISSNSNVR